MRAALAIVLSATLGGTAASAADPPATIERFLLVIGANAGGGDRAKLQYAVSDAERFARVMMELGGVPRTNEVLLRQPKVKELVDALDALSARVKDARRVKDVGRIEVVVYYSGHADEQGLLLAGERYAYRALRDRLDEIPADVRIAVLDACASGAFTRLKGGKLRPPFLVDASTSMRGHAFLTSSAETEAAQESDRIRSSYFTHYLVSGFRGAADISGDGKVTLNEAYQFAFSETLGRTVDTRGGAQHPSYDINLSGSGDVVMTDVRQTTATIVLGEELEGRVFVRNSARELIAEVYKPAGRRVELGVEPGDYDVRLERPKASMTAKARVPDGVAVTLDPRQFGAAALEPTRSRGADTSRFAVAGRHRVEFVLGGLTDPDLASFATSPVTGLRYTMFAREDLAFAVDVARRSGAGVATYTMRGDGTELTSSSSVSLLSALAGVRWNPFTSRHASVQIKPFVAASVGPVFGRSWETFVGKDRASSTAINATTIGGYVGGGVDFHVLRSFSLGMGGGYNWTRAFARPLGASDNHSGPEFRITFGFLFGKGR